MNITITGIDKLASRLDSLGLRVRFAATKAVNDTALACRELLKHEAKASFEGGITPYVERGILFRSAQVEQGGVKAQVYLKDTRGDKGQLSVLEILRPHIKGGGRERKNSERNTRPWYLVPSKHVALDRFGNVPATYMKNILSAAGLLSEAGLRMNQTAASRKRKGAKLQRGVYVVPGVGIFQHQAYLGGGSIPLFFFVNRPQYSSGRYDFYGVGSRFVRRVLPNNIRKHLRVEMKRT